MLRVIFPSKLRVIRASVVWAVLWTMGSSASWATHNRAGEITYSHIQGLTYEVVITTYTKSSALADRPWLYLTWGDESTDVLDSLEREQPIVNLPGDIQRNVYRGTHTYGGPGVYPILVEDPNRNEGVLNMTGSVDTPFAIQSLLIIDPQAGHNNSVQLLNPATENACLNQYWIHNPAAHDPDGDVLTYSLVPSRGFGGAFIPSYVYPDEISAAADVFAIDTNTGDLTWNTPQVAGEYNVAIRIEEWREVQGVMRKVGEVTRDLQIDVQLCANQPPEVGELSDTCVLAGTSLTFEVTATDPDGDGVSMDAVGGALSEVTHPASFVSMAGSGMGTFSWTPQCDEVRAQPYQVVFKAQDLGNAIPLVDIETRQITVISPPVIDLSVEPVGYDMVVNWSPNECVDGLSQTERELGSYEVHRRLQAPSDWEPGLCEVGVPEGEGYALVGNTTTLDDVGWVDESGLSFGVTYCYRVATRYSDGGLSLASEEVCGRIRKDIPVMTRASIGSTGTSDSLLVGWSPPNELDSLAFPGPYRYELWERGTVGAGAFELAWTSDSESSPWNLDTLVWLDGVNTSGQGWEYEIRLHSGEQLVGVPPSATTPWLSFVPDDNRLRLEVQQDVPWRVDAFVIERQVPTGGGYEVLDTVTVPFYVDTNLVNGQTYCYRVTTLGTYDDPSTEQPLVNLSQEGCAQPFDFTAPCDMALEVVPNCEDQRDSLTWQPVPGCESDDIVAYRIYWAPFAGDSLTLWKEFEGIENNEAIFNEDDDLGTIAGCFAVTALDSLNPGPDGVLRRNEGGARDTVCVDNCPYYFLPNVFSPNGDGENDAFRAFPWKFIDSVQVDIFNRYGVLVYQTNDPWVNWDGTYLDTGEPMPDGVYVYTVTAFTRRLEGIVEERFSGELTLVDGRQVSLD